MYYAIEISMEPNCYYSDYLWEIDEIHLMKNDQDYGWCRKEDLYDFLKVNPHTIKVRNSSGPYLIGAISPKNEKYVKSEADDSLANNLLNLPKIRR